MKKLFVLLSAIFLLSAACNKQSVSQNRGSQPSQPPAQNQTQLTVDTSDWKVYANNQYGFEIKYPATAKVIEVPAGFDNIISDIDFNNVEGIDVRVTPYENSRNDKTLNELFQARDGIAMPDTGNIKDYQQVSLSGVNALKVVNSLPDGEKIGASTVILGGRYYYVITTGSQFTPGFDKAKESIYDQILSTFRFTQPSLDLNSIFDLKDKETGTQIYYSDKLGVGFTYINPANTTFKVAVTEIGDKIYIHGTKESPEQGHYVEVFTKDPSISLETAITSTLLENYSSQDCFAVPNSTYAKRMESSSTLVSGEISYPIPANADLEQIQPYFNRCPTQYAKTNGLRYFLMDTNHPNKFLFVGAGQDVIALDGTPQNSAKGFYGFAWEQSIKVLK